MTGENAKGNIPSIVDGLRGQRQGTTAEGWVACHELPDFVSPKARTENESLVQYPSRRQA